MVIWLAHRKLMTRLSWFSIEQSLSSGSSLKRTPLNVTTKATSPDVYFLVVQFQMMLREACWPSSRSNVASSLPRRWKECSKIWRSRRTLPLSTRTTSNRLGLVFASSFLMLSWHAFSSAGLYYRTQCHSYDFNVLANESSQSSVCNSTGIAAGIPLIRTLL